MTAHPPVHREGCPNHYHDTATAYEHGCRCPKAREARRLYMKRRREGRQPPLIVPSKIARRKLRTLMAAGWSISELGKLMGTTGDNVFKHATRPDDKPMFKSMRDIVDRLYRDLENAPGPSRSSAIRARNRGWYPPAAWEFIDDPDASPIWKHWEKPKHNRVDLEEVVYLFESGVHPIVIAKRLGVEAVSLERAAHRLGDAKLAQRLRAAMSNSQ